MSVRSGGDEAALTSAAAAPPLCPAGGGTGCGTATWEVGTGKQGLCYGRGEGATAGRRVSEKPASRPS